MKGRKGKMRRNKGVREERERLRSIVPTRKHGNRWFVTNWPEKQKNIVIDNKW